MNKGYLLNGRGEKIIDTVYQADGSLERMRGLLGRQALSANEGFWIEPCNAVHTFFMRYSLDVLFLDRDGVLLKTVSHLNPWRFTGALNARATIELQAGRAASFSLNVGERLTWKMAQ